MSLHKLAEVTITIEGLPEYTGTDDELQELTEAVENLAETFDARLIHALHEDFPDIMNKIEISVKGIRS